MLPEGEIICELNDNHFKLSGWFRTSSCKLKGQLITFHENGAPRRGHPAMPAI
jgi:hypothetical protein